MYNFIDVNEVSESVLPSEALQINGVYIEDLIPEYRTLGVTGRESLSSEIETYETGVRDGAKIKNKRYPARLITVKYQIKAESPEAFREAYNKLGGILNVQDAMLIFNDETDKYYIGTPYEVGEIDPGRNAVIGEFNILCADPFKYSVQEYVATADDGESSVLVNYGGTHKAYPILEADFYNESEDSEDGETGTPLTGTGDCGFVSFFTEDKKIIQLGDPDEIDIETGFSASQTLMNQPFNSSGAWGTTSKKLWAQNGGYTILNTSQVSAPAMKPLTFINAAAAPTRGDLLKTTVSAANKAPVTYKLTAATSNRASESVKMTVTMSAAMMAKVNAVLTVHIIVGGIERKTFKIRADGKDFVYDANGTPVARVDVDDRRIVTYSTTTSFILTGLTASQKTISNIKCFVGLSNDNDIVPLPMTECADLTVSPYTTPGPVSYYLTASGYGSGTGWHGPVITRSVPADEAGETGADKFKLSYAQVFAAKNSNEIGAFQMNLTDANNKSVAAVVIYKNKTGNMGKIIYYVDGKQVYGTDRDLSQYNEFFGASQKSNKSTTIHKNGRKIVFTVGGIKKTISDGAIANRPVRKVTFAFTTWGTHTPLSYNGIYNLKFIKDNCDTIKDIPNKFSANDVLEADCGTGEIKLNNVLSPELGALGNDWEGFVLQPGFNEIGFAYSSWLNTETMQPYAPKIKIRYREVFL